MKLVVISNDFPPTVGGIENYIYSLVARWPASEVLVITRWTPGCEKFDQTLNFEVIREPVGTLLPTPSLVSKLRRRCLDFKAGVVLFPSSLPLGLMGPALGLPYALSVHGGEFLLASRLPAARQALRFVCGSASVLLPESTFASKLAQRFNRRAVPIGLVNAGVEIERYGPTVSPVRLGLEGPVILSVCRLINRKGPRTLLAAMPEILTRHPKAHLLIVGGGKDLPRLVDMAGRLQVQGNVTLAGSKPWHEMPGHYAAADVFALPTRKRFTTETEGLPLVFVEAAASCLPLVGGDVGGVPDAVREGVTGFLVDGESEQETACAILKILDDPALGRKMGEAARKMVEEEFTWDLAYERLRTALTTYC